MAGLLYVTSDLLVATVCPGIAGRVTSLRYGERELLTGDEVHPTNWGSTFWPSPQADWGWPPPAAIDEAPYDMLADGTHGEVLLRSPLAVLGTRRFQVEKRLVGAPLGSLDVEYRLLNVGEAAFSMASWEISRVAPGGLTFYVSGDAELTPIDPHSELVLQRAHGASWYDHSLFETCLSRKLHADGREGFLAHLVGDLLLLKLFPDTPAECQAPGEGEVELFANFDGKYVEIEVQSAYSSIEPGGCSSFTVRTHVGPVPSSALSDRRALLDLARQRALELA